MKNDSEFIKLWGYYLVLSNYVNIPIIKRIDKDRIGYMYATECTIHDRILRSNYILSYPILYYVANQIRV